MNNIVIVSKENCAFAYGAGVEIGKVGNRPSHANLLVLNEVMKQIPTTLVEDNFRIFLMNINSSIQSGYAKYYVKTGKYLNGNPIQPDELELMKDHYKLYAEGERFMNLTYGATDFIPKMKEEFELKKLRTEAYKKLDAFIKANANKVGAGNVTTVVNDPDKELRETLDAQIKEALMSKDMETAKMLMDMRKTLKDPQVVTTATGSQQGYQPAPEFDIDDSQSLDDMKPARPSNTNLDTMQADNSEEDNDDPIEFEPVGKGQVPDWDTNKSESQA